MRLTERDHLGQQVASAYRAGLADARRQIAEWADEGLQALPEYRTPVAHGKAEVLRDLRAFLAAATARSAALRTPPGGMGG